LIEQWKNKKEKDYTKNIFGIILQDYKDAKLIVQNRGEFIQLMLAAILFWISFYNIVENSAMVIGLV
jgi:hypothetical protein